MQGNRVWVDMLRYGCFLLVPTSPVARSHDVWWFLTTVGLKLSYQQPGHSIPTPLMPLHHHSSLRTFLMLWATTSRVARHDGTDGTPTCAARCSLSLLVYSFAMSAMSAVGVGWSWASCCLQIGVEVRSKMLDQGCTATGLANQLSCFDPTAVC